MNYLTSFIDRLVKRQKKGYRIDKEKLHQKCKRLPLWAKEQIEEDVSAFSDITSLAFENTLKNLQTFYPTNDILIFPIYIKNNQVISPLRSTHPRMQKWFSFLQKMLSYVSLPDMQFLIGIHDTYEEKVLNLLEVPLLVISKKSSCKKIILFPHVEWLTYHFVLLKRLKRLYARYPWEAKQDKAIWRGSSSGVSDIKHNSRYEVIHKSNLHPNIIDAAFSSWSQLEDTQKKEYADHHALKSSLSPEEQLKYKYLLALDGNCFPGSFFWQLSSQCLTFKEESSYLEWYYKGLFPYVHYVPFTPQTLPQKILEWKEKDSKAQEIATTAYRFAKENLSCEDIMCYTYHMLNTYASLQK